MISIIVPVYNSEQYLAQCIESILNQSYRDFELILINDGSSDKSPNICDHYANKDRRIKVIHQVNSGVSSARNVGIELAAGEYVVFCDSDDYVDTNYLHDMINNQNDENTLVVSDIVQMGNTESTQEGNDILETVVLLDDMKKEDYIAFFLEYRLWGPTCKLYSNSIIKNNRIRFRKDLKTAEDLAFNVSYLQAISAIHYIPSSCYYYRVDWKETKPTFISHSMIDSLHAISEALVQIAQRGGVYDEICGDIAVLIAAKFYFSRLPAVFVTDRNIPFGERRYRYKALCKKDDTFIGLCKIGRKYLNMNPVMRIVSCFDNFYFWFTYYKLSFVINQIRRLMNKE